METGPQSAFSKWEVVILDTSAHSELPWEALFSSPQEESSRGNWAPLLNSVITADRLEPLEPPFLKPALLLLPSVSAQGPSPHSCLDRSGGSSSTATSSLSLRADNTRFFKSWWGCNWIISCVFILCHFPDDFVVQKPELSTPSICHAPGGEYFVEGETWNIDSCTQCTCHSGRVLCETEVCPPLLCQNPSRTQDSCCPQCTGDCAARCGAPGGGGVAEAAAQALLLGGTRGRAGAVVGQERRGPRGAIQGGVQSPGAGSLLPKFIPFHQPQIYVVNVPCIWGALGGGEKDCLFFFHFFPP